MTSVVEICNLALSHIRAGSINSLTESSLQAQLCSLKYPILRDQLLEDVPWSFSRKIKALAVLADEDLFNWAYVYQYPTDCLKINRVLINFEQNTSDTNTVQSRLYDFGYPRPNLNRLVDYDIFNIDDNPVIGSNDAELRIDYQAKVTITTLFPSQFVMALSHLLAAELAIPIAGVELGRVLRSDEMTIYGQSIASAAAANYNESHMTTNDSEFIRIRS